MDSNEDRTFNAEQELQEQLLAGVQGNVKQAGKIREQLREMFDPYDYVTIKNPFQHLTGWAYVDPAEEKIEKPDKTTRRVAFGRPKTRVLKVGESIVIHGWEAYIALGRMFKEYAQSQGGNMIIVLSSQDEIDKFLERAFGGKFDPNAQLNAINAQNAAQDIQAKQEAQAAQAVVPSDPLGFGAPADIANPVEAPAPQPQYRTSENPTPEVPAQEPISDEGISEEELLAQGVSQEAIDQQIEQNGTYEQPQNQ